MSEAIINRKRCMTVSAELSGADFWTLLSSDKTSFSVAGLSDGSDFDIYLCGSRNAEEL